MKTTNTEFKCKIKPWTARLILLLGMILFLTACASKTKVQEGDAANLRAKWTKAVSKVIKDPERAEKLIALGVQYEEGNQALFSEIKNINQEIMNINRNYDSTQGDYERALGKFTKKKNEALQQCLDALFAMREQTTPEEWKTLLR
jgi:hypothetical protein